MNRTIKRIDYNKWYHLDTLKKFYQNRAMQTIVQKDADDKSFTFIVFKLGSWNHVSFIVHPITKRLRIPSDETYNEIGFVC